MFQHFKSAVVDCRLVSFLVVFIVLLLKQEVCEQSSRTTIQIHKIMLAK